MDEKVNDAANASEKAYGCFFCKTAKPFVEHCFGSARVHFRNSRIEFLKGMRSIIDAQISHLSKVAEQKGAHVTVE